MDEQDLAKCCVNLESTKVRTRHQGCDDLNELLRQRSVIDFLNEARANWWGTIYKAVIECMNKEHDKKIDEVKKKGATYVQAPQSADTFSFFVRIALKENAINTTTLFHFMLDWLKDDSKKQFQNPFLKILSESLLTNSRVRNGLKPEDWETLYCLLKSFCRETSLSDPEILRCLALVVKVGPLHKLPVSFLREQFSFMKKLCQMITSASLKTVQEVFLELIFDFCKHTAKDNRRACCKLGEDIFRNLVGLHQGNVNEGKMKANLIEFFLFQVVIHNPKGVDRSDLAAYAISWGFWKDCLSNIYDILLNEIERNLELTVKNQSLFICTDGVEQLFDGLVRLFVEVCRQLFGCVDNRPEEPPPKRAKIEMTIANLIDKIQETKSWTWINLTYPLFETYPDMIVSDNYVTLLKVMASLQAECKDATLLFHTHKALIVLLKIESFVDVSEMAQVSTLWKNVADSTLRLMNQNDEHIQKLVQLLIVNKHITSHESLLQCYRTGGALNLEGNNLQTVNVAFKTITTLQFDPNSKKEVMKWILSNSSKQNHHSQMADILVCLVLKQWPQSQDKQTKTIKPFEDIEDLYLQVCFDNLLVSFENVHKNQSDDVYCVDQGLLDTLIEALSESFNKFEAKISIAELFDVVSFVFNALSYLHKFKLIKPEIEDLELYKTFKANVRNLLDNLNFKKSSFNERTLTKLNDRVQSLSLLFKTKISECLSKKLRELVPERVIKEMFGILNTQPEEAVQTQFLALKKNIVETIVTFSCLPDSSFLHIQERALGALFRFDYDYACDDDYELVLTLLRSLIFCNPKSLPVNSLSSVFNVFQKICEVRYYCYVSAVEILDLFCEFYPVVAASSSSDVKAQFVGILYPFYHQRLSYGPALSVSLLKCIGLLFELEPNATYAKWANDEVILKVPEFLTSDYQEIRFTAIKILATFFKVSTKERLLEQFHKQEIMFSKICEMSLQVLHIEGALTDDRMIDETVSRSSSIIHTFASIMIASNHWVEESLFTLLKIVCDKKLSLSQLKRVVDMVAARLGFKSGLKFFEKYLVGLVNRWKVYSFEKFPFSVFDCDSMIKFFAKYWALLAHIFVESERNSLNQVASLLGKSLQQLIVDSCPKLLSYCIGQEISDLSTIANNNIYRLLRDTLGANQSQIFKNNIEEIILCLVEFVSDEKAFRHTFGELIFFPKVTEIRLSVSEFEDSLQFIENSLYNDASVVSYLMRHNPEKVHFILLQLNLRVNGVQAVEDKLRCFHLYSLVASLCVDAVTEVESMQPYLIRDLTHTLLHNIKNHREHPEISKVSCKFFKTILQKILPALSKVVTQFFLVIISRLKYVALDSCEISSACVDMLELLIVQHKSLFISEIQKLDSVPQTPQFQKIFSVYFDVKYGNRKVTLEDEIVQFLDFSRNIESLDECQHSVTHLKTLLTTKKDELERLYTSLRQSRGFSEDCEHSNLHKLICTLITLSSSPNEQMSIEAARCLGEIGPADLATLILQPEKSIPDPKFTPWELVLGCAVSLLSKYLVEGDVTVIRASSVALFQILATKEGRKIVKSETDFGFGAINPSYLTPFCAMAARTTNFNIKVKGDVFVQVIKDDALWLPDHRCHKTWVTKLVCTFLETFEESDFFSCLVGVCKLKTEFCEQIFPLVIYSVLYLNISPLTNVISAQIENFFNKHWDITVRKQESVSITTDRSAVQCMLNVVHFVRLQRSVRKKEIRDMKLDYLRVAKAAHFCTAHFTALLYAELWCQEQISQAPDDYALSTCSYTKLDLIYEKCDEVARNALQSIFRQAYKSVGESDALLGCGTFHLLNPATRVDHYKELGRWDQVTRFYEMEVSLGRAPSMRPLVDSLRNANLYQLSLFCSGASDEPNYECLWRLGRWTFTGSDSSHNTYDKSKFYALKALHEKEEFTFKKSMDEARVCVLNEFVGANMESIKNFYDSFAKLQCLKEIEEFGEAVKHGEVVDLLAKWKIQDEVVCNDYQYLEPVQSQRIVLLGEMLKSDTQRELRDVVLDTIIDYAQYARIEGNLNVAHRILENLRLLPSSNDISAKIQLEEAQLCWNIQDDVTAKCILRQLCTDENVNPRLHAMALKMTGKWMVESSSENRQTIIDSYFHKSLNIMRRNEQKTKEDEKSMLDTYDQLAKFADHEYQDVNTHIKSDIFQKKKQNMAKTLQAVSRVSLDKATRDLQKAVTLKKKMSNIDEIEVRNIETEKNNLLMLALKYYLVNLIRSDNYNMTIFRLFSLLLENQTNEIVKKILENELLKIPTYKFINILPQIIPHISGSGSDLFSQTVNNLIEKCAKDHPYHTLPLILSLALSNKDRDYAESKAVVNDGRTQSAKSILDSLKKDAKLANLITKMETVSVAVIELAYSSSDGADGKSLKVPKKAKIRKIQNFDEVLLPTYHLPVNKSLNYENIVGISSFSDSYCNVGGINAPKRITCRGTDGIDRSQLIKGQDDLRQDARMQQVFTIMNSLLEVNKQTKNLRIRTYKIVPLSMRSGILEWVDNTMPIGAYLTGERGEGGAHARFRPSDATPAKCRSEFKKVASKPNDEKLRIFNKICEGIKPVFHKFFESQFPQPTVWYERRRSYIHSVATSSMCGYILGIGDRHVNNILIDKSTAEVVHIDFGIAFEQGRVLPTPETVPFRLTRDIVDGMGVSGVEGVFRRSCEKTVEVLRLHYQTIITILEVLLYDPLYDWTVSTAEANKRQKDEHDSEFNLTLSGNEESPSRDVNETAERALLRLRAKLQGSESGKSTTVEHQVGTLIQQAVDPSNLCKLFCGWQPYL